MVSPIDDATHAVTTAVSGLAAGTPTTTGSSATNATGTTTGADSTFTTTPPPPSAYRDAVVATPGLVSYWRLGERAGAAAVDETGGDPGNVHAAPSRSATPARSPATRTRRRASTARPAR